MELFPQHIRRPDKIKPKTLKREKELLEQLQKFYSLEKANQIQNLDYFATQIGCYTCDYNAEYFDKVPRPTLSEIQDSEKESFLSIILCNLQTF